MKTYKITFANAEERLMTVTSEEINPIDEVAKWGDYELSVVNIVSVQEVVR